MRVHRNVWVYVHPKRHVCIYVHSGVCLIAYWCGPFSACEGAFVCDVLRYMPTCWMGKELCLHTGVRGCIWLAFVRWHLVPWLSGSPGLDTAGWVSVHTSML